jgi:hypothetical protein
MEDLGYQNGRDARRERDDAFRRKWMGFGQREIFEPFALEVGGTYELRPRDLRDRVVMRVGAWPMVVEGPTSDDRGHETRVRAAYVAREGFRFALHPITLTGMITTALGAQDAELGHAELDRELIVKTTDEARLRRVFEAAELRELMRKHLLVHQGMFLRNKRLPRRLLEKGEGEVMEVRFVTSEGVASVERLRELKELVEWTLVGLREAGVADAERELGVKW